MNISKLSGKNQRLAALAAAFTLVPLLTVVGVAHAAFSQSSVTLSDPQINATGVSYNFQTDGAAALTVNCVKVVFSTTPNGAPGLPTSMSTASAGVNTGASDLLDSHTGFTISGGGTHTLTYSSATAANTISNDGNFVLTGITNGSLADDDFYMTVNTYGNADCSTSLRDSTIVGFIYTNGQTVSLTVDGTLSFAVAGVTGNGSETVNVATITSGLATTPTTIPFSTLTSSTNKIAAQDLTVSTNSSQGYTVATRYTAPPTVNTFTISDLATHTNASPGSFSGSGTEAFGYTTNDATLSTTVGATDRFTSSGGNKWAAFTTTNAEVAYNAAAVANQTTRVGFQAGISPVTEPGAYQTTVIYTATPVY